MEHWFAIYTKSRTEKKVADRLADQHIEVYCPVQTVLRQWSDRKKKVKVAVFPSYVFVKFQDDHERLRILQTPGVVNFVRHLGADAKIRPKEIEAIQNLLGEYEEVSVEPLEKGDKVQIQHGGMKGQQGKIIIAQKDKVIVYIESLGLSLKAEVSKAKVKKVGKEEDNKGRKYHF
ncbi:UpxY family transcription antiterminator [Marivirga harenae]|uniref:UpxY family transcription antiterminator n=1 Tax=Marivirga harenae TaxID=2010992 RepID=UPI0026DF8071|nr:UpxY family transcription antiterminator [Marivirga harenae]WKV13421.1 UpxY family transcription antiterminator [Marivirga harenae]